MPAEIPDCRFSAVPMAAPVMTTDTITMMSRTTDRSGGCPAAACVARGVRVAVDWAAFGIVSTGVHQHEIQTKAGKEIGKFHLDHRGDDDQSAVDAGLDFLEKGVVFAEMFSRVELVVGGPLRTLTSVCGLAGMRSHAP